jgi:hypothetical protein
MTQEALEQAKRIQQALKDVTDAKHAIMAYHNERLELEVTVKKGLMHFVADDEKTRRYTLWSDSPLFVAIAAAIEGMREELQEQLDNLDGNMKPKSCMQQTYEDFHPIAKTTWWQKAFRWAKPK